MARFNYTIGLAMGRTPPGWERTTSLTSATLTTSGVPRDALLTMLWWWEGMLNSRGREKEAEVVRKARLRFLGRKPVAPSSVSTSRVAPMARSAALENALVPRRRRPRG
jgi:hypothetical protein